MRAASILYLAILPGLALAQDGSVTVGNAAWRGLLVRFLAKMEPAGSVPEQLSGGVIPTPDGTHRLLTDAAHKRKFGYDLHAILLPDGQTLRIALGPLGTDAAGRGRFETEPGWTWIAPPKFPVVLVMRAGDVAAIDLLINPSTGQKLVECLSVERDDLDSQAAKAVPRDFTPDDVELFLDRPRVWVNGKLVADSSGGIRAHTLWFYLPGEGTFVISLWQEPVLGFQRAGTLRGNTLIIHRGATEYRVECASPIAPASGLYNVYLHHDAAAPTKHAAEFEIGGADKSAWLVRK